MNLHKIVAVVTFVAQKFLLETELWNAIGYCDFAGLTLHSLKTLEIEYLRAIDYRVLIKKEEFEEYLEILEHQN